MILGMSTATFTLVHVLISLAGIGSGLIVIIGLLSGKLLETWTAVFLITTALTSITGFFFPFHGVTPGIVLGILSLGVLAIIAPARYRFHLSGKWRAIYVIGASIALSMNVIVLVVQSFEKVPGLHALAPTQKEPPFVFSQLAVLAIFVILTIFAIRHFHPKSTRASAASRKVAA